MNETQQEQKVGEGARTMEKGRETKTGGAKSQQAAWQPPSPQPRKPLFSCFNFDLTFSHLFNPALSSSPSPHLLSSSSCCIVFSFIVIFLFHYIRVRYKSLPTNKHLPPYSSIILTFHLHSPFCLCSSPFILRS